MMIKLNSVFRTNADKVLFSREELLTQPLQTAFLSKISKKLNLTYLENSSQDGNLCFANSEELRPEFKTFYSQKEVVMYLQQVMKVDTYNINIDEVPFPRIRDFYKQ